MIYFFKRKHKIIVMRELFFYNNIKRNYCDNFVNLQLDFATMKLNFLLLLLNNDLMLLIRQLIHLLIYYYKNVLFIN